MWHNPWSLREGFTIGGGLIFMGLLLQFCVGPVNWTLFTYPANAVLSGIFLLLVLALEILRKRFRAIRSLASWQTTVPALIYAVVLTALMGMTIQLKTAASDDPVGLTNMLSFWPFVLIYIWMTLIVGMVAVRQLRHVHWRTIPPLLPHLGLFIILLCGTLGTADMQRLKMYCEMGQPEWRALDEDNNAHELPVAIQLNKFIMEEYTSDRSPKRFASDVEIMTQEGQHIKTTIEVNKPVVAGGWKIYQYGYDTAMGAQSRYSVFELVRDPWLPIVYAGIAMLALGALLTLFFTSTKRKETAA